MNRSAEKPVLANCSRLEKQSKSAASSFFLLCTPPVFDLALMVFRIPKRVEAFSFPCCRVFHMDSNAESGPRQFKRFSRWHGLPALSLPVRTFHFLLYRLLFSRVVPFLRSLAQLSLKRSPPLFFHELDPEHRVRRVPYEKKKRIKEQQLRFTHDVKRQLFSFTTIFALLPSPCPWGCSG